MEKEKINYKKHSLLIGIPWVILTIILSIMVLYNNPEIKFFGIDPTLKGLKLFVSNFEYPLYFLALFIPFIGIYIAVMRMMQTEQILETNKGQLKAFSNQYNQTVKSNFDFTFFRLIEIYKSFIDDLRYKGKFERECFVTMHQDFSRIFHNQSWHTIKKKLPEFSGIYQEFSSSISEPKIIERYVQVVFEILFHIEQNKEYIDWGSYIRIFKPILSQSERLFLLYHSMAMNEKGLAELISKFRILPEKKENEPLKSGDFRTWTEFEKLFRVKLNL